MDSTTLADKIALRELVDKVAIYGDRKKLQEQLLLFTEDALSKTYAGATLILDLKGRSHGNSIP